jgi:hypothetical protein
LFGLFAMIAGLSFIGSVAASLTLGAKNVRVITMPPCTSLARADLSA